jgi:uncharacterized protein with HEPN domain
MRADDRNRIKHMLDAATEAYSFTKGQTRAGLDKNMIISLGVTS